MKLLFRGLLDQTDFECSSGPRKSSRLRSRARFFVEFALVGFIAPLVFAQPANLDVAASVKVGSSFSIPTSGSGAASLYIVGPDGAFRRNVDLGKAVEFSNEDITNAGHYSAFLVSGATTQSGQFDSVPSPQPATLSFLAKPSRLPVDISGGLSGVVYVFDIFGNLIIQPQQISFDLTNLNGQTQSRVATTRDGVVWVKMNSAAKAGTAKFTAGAGPIRETRIVQQVAGDPCSLRMAASKSGKNILVETSPVLDCSHNLVPDGTIVTFTETYAGRQATVDVPIKRGIARTELPDEPNATISVAAGVVLGNEIRWSGR
jgi:hypothetical protein